jgi:uncharacterized membrane protein
MATVEETIEVQVPVSAAYDRWAHFESFPLFMEGIVEVRMLDETFVHWVAEVGGRRREWDTEIIRQVPDRVIEWRAIDNSEPSGEVRFQQLDPSRTRVQVHFEYEPRGAKESLAASLGLDDRRVKKDLECFKEVVETSAAWREGSANWP